MASTDVKPVGTTLAAGGELAAVESIKMDLVVPVPVAGKVVINGNVVCAARIPAEAEVAGWIRNELATARPISNLEAPQ